jgi:hypothetical protein
MRLSLGFPALAVLALAVVCGASALPLSQGSDSLMMLDPKALLGSTGEELSVRMSPGSAHSGDRDSPPREHHRKGKGKRLLGKLKNLTIGKKDKGKGVSTSHPLRSTGSSPVREGSRATTPAASPSPEWDPPYIRDPDTPSPSPPHPVGPFPGDYHGPPRPPSKGKKVWNAVKKIW